MYVYPATLCNRKICVGTRSYNVNKASLAFSPLIIKDCVCASPVPIKSSTKDYRIFGESTDLLCDNERVSKSMKDEILRQRKTKGVPVAQC